MENRNKDRVWLANYYHRQKALAADNLKELANMGVQPNYKKRRVKKMTLAEYIQFLGEPKAAEDFGASLHAIKSWRYGYRQPSIAQAKKIIRATDGRLDYESIFGSLASILETTE